MYSIIRKILFLLPPERAHYVAMDLLGAICSFPPFAWVVKKLFTNNKAPKLTCFGLQFPNTVGLAAGFDKNAKYLQPLSCLGFGHVEIGTVTPVAQAGNPKPRLFRLPKSQALINRMGFNNDGADAVAKRLAAWRQKKNPLIIGGNIGKNKITANENAWQDYVTCVEKLQPYVDYFVVNVSSPNTPGLRELQEKDALLKIISSVQQKNLQMPNPRPVLLKIAPDLNVHQVNDIIALAQQVKLDGLIVSNTSLDRSFVHHEEHQLQQQAGAGGLSGAPVKNINTDLIKYICTNLPATIPVIGSGGIMNAADAKEKFSAGASLVQVWTGFIYTGPAIAKQIAAVKI